MEPKGKKGVSPVEAKALLLSLHVFGIALSLGYNAVAIRDFGLAFASLALAVGGAGTFSIDTKAETAPL